MNLKKRSHNNQKDFDVLAVDGIDVDWLFKMAKLPSFDEKLPAEFLGRFPGGPVGNFACVGSSLGLSVASMCTLGDDDGGKMLLEDFRSFGIDVDYISIDENSMTPFVLVIVDPTGEKSVIIPEMPVMRQKEISKEAIARSRYVYLAAKNDQKLFSISEIAKQVGTQIMVDIEPSKNLKGKKILDILRHCDIASFNQQGFSSAFGKDFSIGEAKQLLDYGPKLILVTQGANGVVGVTADEVIQQPAFNVDVKDTTGAGDTFNAAFLYATLREYEVRDRLKFGCAAAAILIQSIGTRTMLPSLESIENILN